MRNKILAGLFHSLGLTAACSAQEHSRVPLWPNGAPGSEARRQEAEVARDWWVKNVHDPSLTVYLPAPEKASGAAVVVVPGGGHERLVYEAHVAAKGGHGFNMGQRSQLRAVNTWPQRLVDWLVDSGLARP